MSDLDHLAEKFKRYKGNRSYCRYPEHLWDKAYELTHHYSLQDVASALSLSPQYLKRKFAKRKPITFASVTVAPSPPSPAPVTIQFKQVTIHTDEGQAISMIHALMEEA